MNDYPWTLFFMLWIAAVLSAVAVLPYAFKMNSARLAEAPFSRRKLTIISVIQSAITMGIAAGIGLLAARSVGLKVSLVAAVIEGNDALPSLLDILPLAAGLGALGGIGIFVVDRYVFAPFVPDAIKKINFDTTARDRLSASFYGGIGEEILMRLFLMSSLAWLIGQAWHNGGGQPTSGAFWTANIVSTVLFGIGHLPATKALTPITPVLVVRAITANGVGIIFGYLFWQYGLEAAMIGHFSTDIVFHVIIPLIARPSGADTFNVSSA